MKKVGWAAAIIFVLIFGGMVSLHIWSLVPQPSGNTTIDIGNSLFAWAARIVAPALTVFTTITLVKMAKAKTEPEAK